MKEPCDEDLKVITDRDFKALQKWSDDQLKQRLKILAPWINYKTRADQRREWLMRLTLNIAIVLSAISAICLGITYFMI
jgi:hypothetical protein